MGTSTDAPAGTPLTPAERRELAHELDESLARLSYLQRLAIGGKLFALIEGLFTGATLPEQIEQIICALAAQGAAHESDSVTMPAAA